MPLSCPRCSTNVPEEALYCPYCNLPKPKTGFTAASAAVQRENRPVPGRPPRPARTNRSPKQPTRTRSARSFRIPAIVALVVLGCAVAYVYVVPLVYSDGAEPKVILAALETLRRMPSSEEGLTIDARMTRELEKSRRGGNLVGYQGWTVKSIKGTKSRVVISFSYDERGNVRQRAEWLADLSTNTFTPQNEFAALVSGTP